MKEPQVDGANRAGDAASMVRGHDQPLTPPDAAIQLSGFVTLRDGSRAYIRPIRPDDAPRLQRAFAQLSAQSVMQRFFTIMPALKDSDARHFADVDYDSRMALVAGLGPEEDTEGLAVVRYDRTEPAAAEVAFVVRDDWQGRGLALEMLHRLVRYARAHGIERFVAVVMLENRHMLSLLHHAGYPLTSRIEDGEVIVTLDIREAL